VIFDLIAICVVVIRDYWQWMKCFSELHPKWVIESLSSPE